MAHEIELAACEEAFQKLVTARTIARSEITARTKDWALWNAKEGKTLRPSQHRTNLIVMELLGIGDRASLEQRDIGILLTEHPPLLSALRNLNLAKEETRVTIAAYRKSVYAYKSKDDEIVAKEWLTKGQLSVGDKAELLKRWPNSGEKISLQRVYRVNRIAPCPVERWHYFWDAGVKRSVTISRAAALSLVHQLKAVEGVDKEAYRAEIEALSEADALRKVSVQRPQLKVLYRLTQTPDTGKRTYTCPGHGIIVLPQRRLPEDFEAPAPLTPPPPSPLNESSYQPVVKALGLYLHTANKKRGRKPREAKRS